MDHGRLVRFKLSKEDDSGNVHVKTGNSLTTEYVNKSVALWHLTLFIARY